MLETVAIILQQIFIVTTLILLSHQAIIHSVKDQTNTVDICIFNCPTFSSLPTLSGLSSSLMYRSRLKASPLVDGHIHTLKKKLF
ncbi:hypothetical protein F4813DRAFT_364438 [Daldinia decipiens]|uniref:uncharacterized protein n=1 Tax=Daldinia decipiens TaxID=326647 RepID=UPI0020C4A6A8|nr:uncharacterized protein F4813DRAFT_364438 [Daldinia decipiens]KAI1656155.1 hypothetical protein F4813DRAFT_364438 [Daldinia decipiens]